MPSTTSPVAISRRSHGIALFRLLAVVALLFTQSSAATDYLFTHLAGPLGGPGSADGPGTTARFANPVSLTVDGAGNVFVVDRDNHTIRKITPAGVVSTLKVPGTPGTPLLFSFPAAIAVDPAGNLYVADSNLDLIYRVAPDGTSQLFAGASYTHYVVGNQVTGDGRDGTGADARFFSPNGMAADAAGNVYVADTGNHTIRKITPAGVVTTVAGTAGESGIVDGVGATARFIRPTSVAVDSAGILYVADQVGVIRRIAVDGTVTTLAGSLGNLGAADGTGNAAKFNVGPRVAVNAAGTVYVADTANATIRQITPAGVVTTLAGTVGQMGGTDGTGAAARFKEPAGIATDATGNIYVADPGNYTIRRVTPAGVVTTLAGVEGDFGTADGTGPAARFHYPQGVTVDSSGNVYVADFYNHSIRKITPAGVVTTFAGLSGTRTSYGVDGVGTAARFFYPSGVAIDRTGNLYVADAGSNSIRKITPDGTVTTLAGKAGVSFVFGSTDGKGPDATFSYPEGIAVDTGGTIYVADTGNRIIRRITPDGTTSTLAGTAGVTGTADGTGPAAQFAEPLGIAADEAGNVYVADAKSHTIRKVTSAGVVTTVAGAPDQMGTTDGPGVSARFNRPTGLAIDTAGNLFVGDSNNLLVRKIAPDGTVSTIGGNSMRFGSADGLGSEANFYYPSAMAVDSAGTLYFADQFNHAIRKGQLATAPAITTQPQSQTVAPGGGAQFSVVAASALPVTYQWYFNGIEINGATASAYSVASASASHAGNYTVVARNQLGSTVSNQASLTLATAPTSPPSSGGGGGSGGGGAPSWWFIGALLVLSALRRPRC